MTDRTRPRCSQSTFAAHLLDTQAESALHILQTERLCRQANPMVDLKCQNHSREITMIIIFPYSHYPVSLALNCIWRWHVMFFGHQKPPESRLKFASNHQPSGSGAAPNCQASIQQFYGAADAAEEHSFDHCEGSLEHWTNRKTHCFEYVSSVYIYICVCVIVYYIVPIWSYMVHYIIGHVIH